MYDEKTEVDVTLDCPATSNLNGEVLAYITYVPDIGAYDDWRVATNEGRDGSWKIPYDVRIEYELVLPSWVEMSISEMGTRELGTVNLSKMLDPLDVDALDSDDSDARGLAEDEVPAIPAPLCEEDALDGDLLAMGAHDGMTPEEFGEAYAAFCADAGIETDDEWERKLRDYAHKAWKLSV